jgi:hypothetical protein
MDHLRQTCVAGIYVEWNAARCTHQRECARLFNQQAY